MQALRWLVVLASPLAALALAFALALLLLAVIERRCPPELMVSGMCTAAWYPAAALGAYAAAALAGGLLFVALPARIAPRRRRAVAWLALAAGATYAAWGLASVGGDALLPFAAALAGGFVALRGAYGQRG